MRFQVVLEEMIRCDVFVLADVGDANFVEGPPWSKTKKLNSISLYFTDQKSYDHRYRHQHLLGSVEHVMIRSIGLVPWLLLCA